MQEYAFQMLVFAIFAAAIAFLLFRMNRYGGFRAAMFGARIERTVGEVDSDKQGLMDVGLKVHVLRRDVVGKLVGVEIVAKSYASYRMMPVTLSIAQAQQLVSLLNEALRAP
jgi:hypothetical protein